MTTMETDNEEVRMIDAGEAPARFARGWHCVGLTRELRDGKPHSVHAFGTKLVVFADSEGELQVLDAYCRHMGGDLSQGEIKGDSVACPFHDWRWNGKGRCTDIPYARRVPPLAKTRAWTTMEKDGLLFVWHDPEGNPPPPEVTIPDMSQPGEEWTDWVWKQITIDTNCREIIDNVVDMAHFFYVHYGFPIKFKNVFEGHIATQYYEGVGRDDMVRATSKQPAATGNDSVASYYGPSFMIDELTYHYPDFSIDSILINCHYPIAPNKFVLMYGIKVKQSDAIQGEKAQDLAKTMASYITIGFEQDVAIWKNKTRIENPLLCEEDGPVYQLRRWYEQFYVDVADITPDMVARFEFEMDTSKPVAAWKREVAENMERRAAEIATSN
ncbi:Rieske 2Fe-2S domain-containing protein [Prescottella agglutinans]|uniref:Rieske-type oxygenase n=1 Tax=Prescottella agglutinans TaxID=1644129 RepID=A0ABT6MHV0_9NOCA|nr:Rieske 2Fe-2S domain-containing protein [Prescottella agglutinans]MDH6283867.1 3-ketosteroid 9alpha-monooxygenase subunit A [Prescottella agglutinans]WFR73116.1 Rieske 2Fe-2S domain-containing protein [Prescottella defluvii]